MATRDHSSSMMMKEKNALNDADGKIVCTVSLSVLLKHNIGVWRAV